jgi:hypothetical protein
MDEDGQLHTHGLIEKLRAECKRMWGASSELYFRIDELLRELANPNLHEIFSTSAFQIESWDRHAKHIRWVVAATASITIGHAAFDAAVAQYAGGEAYPSQGNDGHSGARAKGRLGAQRRQPWP